MSQIDPWEKAAECENSLKAAADPQQWAILANLRDLWIALGSEKSLSAVELAKEIEVVSRLQADFIAASKRPPT